MKNKKRARFTSILDKLNQSGISDKHIAHELSTSEENLRQGKVHWQWIIHLSRNYAVNPLWIELNFGPDFIGPVNLTQCQ